MKPDISSREDIHQIVSEFYKKLLADKLMQPFFSGIISENNLEHHLEILTDFWQDILFDTSLYKRNTMQKHLYVHAHTKFKQEHFRIWMSYFSSTIDNCFFGDKANNMKSRATSISTVMQLKLNIFEK